MAAGKSTIRIRTNSRQVRKALEKVFHKQIPLATARAINTLRFTAVKKVRREMPHRFRIRNRGIPKQVQAPASEKARRSQWPKVRGAVVVKRLDFMRLQDTGGTKKGKAGHRIAIPTARVARKRTTTGKIPKRLRPKELRRRGKAGVVERPGGKAVIVAHLGPRQRKRRGALNALTLYILRKKARIRPRFHFRKDVKGVVKKDYKRVFKHELEIAVRAARIRKVKLDRRRAMGASR